jgi:hypothetical protein
MREMWIALISEMISVASVPDVCQISQTFPTTLTSKQPGWYLNFSSRFFLILYIFHAIISYTHIYYQPTTQYIVLMLLHVSATNSSHLQGATALEGTYSSLSNLSAVNDKLYTCGIITQLINNY